MVDFPQPLPPKPDFEAKPKASPLWWLIAGFGGLLLLALVAFLATPVLWVAFAIALVIALQYLLWGWWFERIYRSGPLDETTVGTNPTPNPAKPGEPMR